MRSLVCEICFITMIIKNSFPRNSELKRSYQKKKEAIRLKIEKDKEKLING